MARATRIALDLALVSLRTIGPVFHNIWSATKGLLVNTPAKPLVCNPLVRKAESALNQIGAMLVSKIITLRDRQLPREVKYLEKELEKVKKKMDQKGDSASKSLRPAGAVAWRYAKVEMIPPLTQGFFHGAAGKKLEDGVSKFADGVIAGLEGRIRQIEAEKENQRKAKEAAIQAAHDKAMAEAKKKEEQQLKEEAAKKAIEAKKAMEAKKATEAKKAMEAEKAKEKAAKVEKKAEVKGDSKTTKPQRNKAKKVKKKEITKTKGGPKGKR